MEYGSKITVTVHHYKYRDYAGDYVVADTSFVRDDMYLVKSGQFTVSTFKMCDGKKLDLYPIGIISEAEKDARIAWGLQEKNIENDDREIEA